MTKTTRMPQHGILVFVSTIFFVMYTPISQIFTIFAV